MPPGGYPSLRFGSRMLSRIVLHVGRDQSDLLADVQRELGVRDGLLPQRQRKRRLRLCGPGVLSSVAGEATVQRVRTQIEYTLGVEVVLTST